MVIRYVVRLRLHAVLLPLSPGRGLRDSDVNLMEVPLKLTYASGSSRIP